MSDLTVTVTKDELLGILRINMARHRQVFEDALEGYREEASRQLTALIGALRDGGTPAIRLLLPLPKDHTRDYERVIRMVGMHQGDTLELEEFLFAQYVEDDWGWRQEFLTTATSYAAGSVHANYGAGG